MTELIWTFTSITFLVLLGYSVEQLGNTYTYQVAQRRAALDKLDDLIPDN